MAFDTSDEPKDFVGNLSWHCLYQWKFLLGFWDQYTKIVNLLSYNGISTAYISFQGKIILIAQSK